VTTILKVLPLLFVGFAGLAYFSPEPFVIADTRPPVLGANIIAVVTLTLWAFLGLETATIPAAAVRDAARVIPRATVLGTCLAAMLYIVCTVGVMSVVPAATLASTTAPFADAARVIAGDTAARLVALGAAISCFGALNAWVLLVGQVPMAMAADGLFPRVFGHLSPLGTPTRGMIVGGVLTSILIATNYADTLVAIFTFIILLATLSVLVPYAFCSLAVFVRATPARVGRRARVVAGLAFAYSLVAIAGAGQEPVYWGFLLLIAGLPVYVGVVRSRRVEGVA
jgi:APA family basic amino acid/polyamine antiporter